MAKKERDVAVLWPRLTVRKEQAVLVGLQLPKREREDIEDSLEELKQLAQTAGTVVSCIAITKRQSPDPAFYIGTGKADEIAVLCQEKGLNVVIFDDDLSPAQVKNLQNLFGLKVIDRTELILDIFAQHANSREGKIQVELAQLQYMLPRLVHAWTHLGRQWGGVGTRGPGERQLEVDRRRIRAQIAKLKKDLVSVGNHRHLQRKRRERVGIPLVSFIGYTNAGKTTLFNRLTESKLPVEDKLFTTLDPKIKKVLLPNNQAILFSDTVGFIRKLPHHLVESFKATLEEVREADLILHVIDGAAHNIEGRYDVVIGILKELDVIDKSSPYRQGLDKPMLVVVNKIDLLANQSLVNRLCRKFPVSLSVSAKDGTGISDLIGNLQKELSRLRQKIDFFIPNKDLRKVSKIYSVGRVLKEEYTEKGVRLTAELPPQATGEFKQWMVNPHTNG